MPVLDGVAATGEIVGPSADARRVLVVTTFDVDDYVYEALRAGASGFMFKNAPPEELVRAVRVLAGGEAGHPPAVTRRVIEQFADRGPATPAATAALAELTDREREGVRPRGPRAVQRGDRRAAGRLQRHGEDPRRPGSS